MIAFDDNQQNPMANIPIAKDAPTAGWKEVSIVECSEPLVPLGSFGPYTGSRVITEGIYFGETNRSPYKHGELKGSLITQFVRYRVAESLVHASMLLPKNQFIVVLDAYRPLTVQKALYDDFFGQLKGKGFSTEVAEEQAQRFVSKPSAIPTRPSPHSTGASVDLTIVEVDNETAEEIEKLTATILKYDRHDKHWPKAYKAEIQRTALLRNKGRELNMGTAFDEVSNATSTHYYEDKDNLSAEEKECRDNRRILSNVMRWSNFSVYEDEWWHFDLGNQFDAKRSNDIAIYGAAKFDENCAKHEKMMRDHYFGSQKLLAETNMQPQSKLNATNLYRKVVCDVAVNTLKEIGSVKNSSLSVTGHRLNAEKLAL